MPSVLITGANRGLGLEFARQYLADGWQVYAACRGNTFDYFLVSESEFDEIFGRIRERTLPYWSDPAQTQRDEINHHDGGRGLYFEDPNGHLLEIIHPALRQRQLESLTAEMKSGSKSPDPVDLGNAIHH